MIRKLVGLLLIIGALLGLKELHQYWEKVKVQQAARDRESSTGAATRPEPSPPGGLSGLPPGLEASLEEAKRQSPAALRLWIEKYRPYVQDPRLASIELDYVVLIGGRNYLEARKIFHAVRERTPTNSPVYPRIQQLERNYP
ncbi:MAG: hypothetical protein KJ072_23345 [Verrucomicrobia bacterium]|nr:hypothetical protein [Verrucomicrobiota bacterium]